MSSEIPVECEIAALRHSAPHDAALRAPALLALSWLAITMFLWLFAFWHVPGRTPDWLLRAQSACFGTTSTGLPDTYGWMLLVLAPLSLLSAIIAVYGMHLISGLRAMLGARGWGGLLALLLLCSAFEVVWITGRIRTGLAIARTEFFSDVTTALPAEYPRVDEPAPELSLVDQWGKRVSLADFRGHPVLLTFAFAHCQTVCPAVIQTVKLALGELAGERPVLLVVTLDPWRDTPSTLPTLAREWELGAGEFVLSGAIEEVEAVHRAYKMPIERNMQSGDVVHPAFVYIIGADGVSRYLFNNPPADWIVEAVRRTHRLSS